jgi:hypothetical protein
MHMVIELAASLPAWSRLAGDLFLQAVVISSNELMIINSGYCFLLHTWLLPPGYVFVMFLLQVPKEKKEKRRKKMFSFRN